MRIGIIGSAGGSAFAAMQRILDARPSRVHSFHVLTDRPCGLEDVCAAAGIAHRRVVHPDNQGFSVEARKAFDEFGGVAVVLTFFARLLTGEFFDHYPTFNIHPGLLPAFKGMGAVRAACRTKVRFLGATLHKIDASVDGGPIVAQVAMPITPAHREEELQKFSFLQKVYLGLLLVDLMEREGLRLTATAPGFLLAPNLPYTDRCNPAIQDPRLLAGISALQQAEAVEVIA